MELFLRPFTPGDMETCHQWAEAIAFQQYQSRYTPRSFNAGDGSFNAALCSWYIIVVDEEDVGTVWLEKETSDEEVAVLGIMISRPDRFGKGIGRQAIRQAIRKTRDRLVFRSVELHVRTENTRAITCYQHCGFVMVREGIKTGKNGCLIPFLTMKLDL